MKRYIKFTKEPELLSNPEYYYQIMNLLDDVALSRRNLTDTDRKRLDALRQKDIDEGLGSAAIEDYADANDCYTPNGDLCSTWDEMVVALRDLFKSGDRVSINSSTKIKSDLYSKALDIAKRLNRIELALDPYRDAYEDSPTPKETAEEIVNDVQTGKSLKDFPVIYGVQEYLKDIKQDWNNADSDVKTLIREYEKTYNELKTLMGF